MKKLALVGFSVNTEIWTRYDGLTTLEKAELKSIEARVGGTSANVALAIQSFGQASNILALVGQNGDFESHNLDYVLKKCKVPHKTFPVLTSSHLALIPENGITSKKVFGKKGTIIRNKLFEESIEEIRGTEGSWGIATGVRQEETELVESLFHNRKGYRSLNPRMELVINGDIKRLLKISDLLILNQAEYQSFQETSPQSLHEYGPELIIVTDAENGGTFSLKGKQAQRFKAYNNYSTGKEIFTTGAGDWFHGAFISKCMENNKSIYDLSIEDVHEYVDFSAKVAAKKVTIEGASNGPNKEDL